MKFPLLLFLGAVCFTRASTQGNNTNEEQQPYSPPTIWANFTQCRQAIEDGRILSSNPTFRPVFVDGQGNPVDGPVNASGVDYVTCVNYCGTSRSQTSWSPFSQQFTSWLLPFIALTAQLPFQAATTWDNLMSAALTVGSPALAAYSLILTLFGNRWLQKQCAVAMDDLPVNSPETRDRRAIIGHMKEVFCLARQEPYEGVKLHSPSNLTAELEWWRKLEMTVEKSKRGYTASFVHQLLWVNVAFAFTVVDAFGSQNIGNDTTAYGLAISLVWQWETPIVMGWVLVGTSAVEYAVKSAIHESTEVPDALTDFFKPYNIIIERCKIKGDRAQPGPIFNYARASIWTERAETILERYRQNRPPSQWRSASYKHMIYSLCLSLVLQWSVSSASIILCYFTPSVGIACWSGGFLIYTLLATAVLLFLIISAFLSDLSIPPNRDPPTPAKRNLGFGLAAVILRALAKIIAVLNSVWICIHCIFGFTSFYDNCWCNSCAVLGQKAYWTWLSAAQLKELPNITQTWSGSTALAIVVPGLYITCFLITRHHYF